MSYILLTGGFGYIGTHIITILARENINFIVYDNFTNCKKSVIKKLEKITNNKVNFIEGDIRDKKLLEDTFKSYKITSVIHLAALKSINNSIARPLDYFDVNVTGTINLLNVMNLNGVKKLIFSSSAAIYGEPKYLPIDEIHPLKALNPYGETKLIVENLFKEIISSDKKWSIVCLRYFNPIGSHQSKLIGDDPLSEKSVNLMPAIINVVKGFKKELDVFGNNYKTKDGTGVRDYIHIMDLAEAHFKASQFINSSNGLNIFNLGTGKGISVMELVKTFENVTGLKIPLKIKERRQGEVSSCYADPTKANNFLDWHANYNLEKMTLSAWEFSKENI
tara:strand:- start:1199 stop:2203 length:1005 start_codon:yes stop_codon:yes gene_type:complete